MTHLFGTSINCTTDHFRCSVLSFPNNNRSSNACDTFALVNITALNNMTNELMIQNPTNNIDAILIAYNSCRVHETHTKVVFFNAYQNLTGRGC